MPDSTPTPIVDEHQAFAAALVALARKYEVDDLTVQFRLTGGRRFFRDQRDRYNPTRVSFHWHSGRHGARSSYTLRAEAEMHIDEPPHNSVEE